MRRFGLVVGSCVLVVSAAACSGPSGGGTSSSSSTGGASSSGSSGANSQAGSSGGTGTSSSSGGNGASSSSGGNGASSSNGGTGTSSSGMGGTGYLGGGTPFTVAGTINGWSLGTGHTVRGTICTFSNECVVSTPAPIAMGGAFSVVLNVPTEAQYVRSITPPSASSSSSGGMGTSGSSSSASGSSSSSSASGMGSGTTGSGSAGTSSSSGGTSTTSSGSSSSMSGCGLLPTSTPSTYKVASGTLEVLNPNGDKLGVLMMSSMDFFNTASLLYFDRAVSQTGQVCMTGGMLVNYDANHPAGWSFSLYNYNMTASTVTAATMLPTEMLVRFQQTSFPGTSSSSSGP